MRKGTKIQILDRNHPDFLRYGFFVKNKLGKKALITVGSNEIVIPRSSIEQV